MSRLFSCNTSSCFQPVFTTPFDFFWVVSETSIYCPGNPYLKHAVAEMCLWFCNTSALTSAPFLLKEIWLFGTHLSYSLLIFYTLSHMKPEKSLLFWRHKGRRCVLTVRQYLSHVSLMCWKRPKRTEHRNTGMWVCMWGPGVCVSDLSYSSLK